MIKHFGCEIRTSEPYLTRENYIHSSKEFETIYDGLKSDLFANLEERVAFKKTCVLLNFDLNMAYFRSLDSVEFLSVVEEQLVHNPNFMEVTDLNDYKCSGIYVLVLGEYKQIYVGESDNIKIRIQQHWTNYKDLFRQIFGGIFDSKIPIDSFRALDTTQIFVYPFKNNKNQLWKLEHIIVDLFPNRYLCNRMNGGNPFEQALGEGCFKFADLPDITENNIKNILPNYTWESFCAIIELDKKVHEDLKKGYSIKIQEQEEIESKRHEQWEKEAAIERERLDGIKKDLENKGFCIEKDFPDYMNYRGANSNLVTIKNNIDKSIKKDYDISIYKGLKTIEITKVFICLENGISADKAVQFSKDFARVSDLKTYFSPPKPSKKKRKK